MNNGWIKLHRKILKWEWFDDPNTCHFFQYCKLRANFEDNKWRGIVIEKGSFISSLSKMAKETGLTIQQVRTSIKKLKSTHELTSETTNRYTVIAVTNYELYQQDNTPPNNQTTNKQQTDNKRITTDKNNKKDSSLEESEELKKEKKKKILSTLPEEAWTATDSLIAVLKDNNAPLKNIDGRARRTWAEHIDKLNRIDGVDYEKINAGIEYIGKHYGEKYLPLILSAAKLREKWCNLHVYITKD